MLNKIKEKKVLYKNERKNCYIRIKEKSAL